ncbi:isopentenyl-diphosphate delta-isomerase [Luminiphilus sp.]|nr:isopentenyl-diphosphate delta-isomerase [Luminiphilus sp.]
MLVDTNDVVIGYEEKASAHQGEGQLHRAFSIFLLNDYDEVLLQQRSSLKPLWPMYWSNTCCSHPRRGETLAQSTTRRLREELNLEAPLKYLYKFQYHARYEAALGSEHELCSVFLGHVQGRPKPKFNQTEIADTVWLPITEVNEWLSNDQISTTPWFALEWKQLQDDHAAELKRAPRA